jgi:hypothetical protein
VPALSGTEATLGPGSAATRTAQAILYRLNHGDLTAWDAPSPRCSLVTSGRIGPLDAPYEVCPVSAPPGHFVDFTATDTSTKYGLTYTDAGPATFEDECYRHLYGPWYEFRQADLSNPASPCSSGWRFHGGG